MCVVCDDPSDSEGSEDYLVRTSKFLSYVLRHRPGAIGLVLDKEGWASMSELLDKSKSQLALTDVLIREVVSKNDKQRFSISDDGLRIRANQGHSIEVDLELKPLQPPRFLYHGTAEQFLLSIRKGGLLPGRRRYVHLSVDAETARMVGQRHGRPVVLRVASEDLYGEGFDFYRSDNGVWLTRHVPSQFLYEVDSMSSADSAKTSRQPKLST